MLLSSRKTIPASRQWATLTRQASLPVASLKESLKPFGMFSKMDIIYACADNSKDHSGEKFS